MPPAITISPAAMGRLTVPIRLIATMVAMHGGNTFQTNMFSTVKIAFDDTNRAAELRPGLSVVSEIRTKQ